jgi:hypothetical protein
MGRGDTEAKKQKGQVEGKVEQKQIVKKRK